MPLAAMTTIWQYSGKMIDVGSFSFFTLVFSMICEYKRVKSENIDKKK